MLRMVKDKNKPKGPMSAYACFVQVIREEHKKKHPEESVVFSEFSKKCAEKWKTMTDKEKQRFDDMASRDKERYIREMDAYIPPDGVKKPRKRRRNKDPGQPKRALSAFFFFCEEKRPAVRTEHPDWKVGDIAKELGRQWELCQCKGKYESQAIADKSRYEREMIEFKNGTFTMTKRARLEDVISGKISGMTAAGNGYQMKPDSQMPVYSIGATTQPQIQPQSLMKPEMPAYDAQGKPDMPSYESQVKTEIPGAGPSYGATGAPTDGIPHPATYSHQGFTQAPAQQPPPQTGVPQEPAVALQPQAYGGMMAQDLSAPPQPQPGQLQQPQQQQSQPQQQQQPSQPPPQQLQQPQQQQPQQQQQQVSQPGVSHDLPTMQHHATPGGDTVDLSAERNGGSTAGVSGIPQGSNEELRSGGANGEEDEDEEEEEEEDDEEDGGDE